MKLSWKVFRVLSAGDPLSAAAHVPGPANTRTFLAAAAAHGVPEPLVSEAERAVAAFQRFVATQAGERAAFDSMVSGVAPDAGNGPLNLQHKRAAFRANRHIWGLQAKTLLRTLLVQPADDPDLLAAAIMHGYYDLRWLRPGGALLISRERVRDNDGTIRQVTREPLDPSGPTEHGLSLLRDYCSRPLPRFRTVDAGPGFVHSELLSDGVGNRAALTCVHGSVMRAAGPRFRDPHNDFFRMSVLVRVPAEELVFDLMVREDTFGSLTRSAAAPTVQVYDEHASDGPGPPRERDVLPLKESVVYLGRGPAVLHTPSVPRYMEMAEYACARLGWDAAAFAVYRCHVQYPVLGTTVRIVLPLAEKAV